MDNGELDLWIVMKQNADVLASALNDIVDRMDRLIYSVDRLAIAQMGAAVEAEPDPWRVKYRCPDRGVVVHTQYIDEPPKVGEEYVVGGTKRVVTGVILDEERRRCTAEIRIIEDGR